MAGLAKAGQNAAGLWPKCQAQRCPLRTPMGSYVDVAVDYVGIGSRPEGRMWVAMCLGHTPPPPWKSMPFELEDDVDGVD